MATTDPVRVTGSAEAAAEETAGGRSSRLASIGIGLAVALAIIVAAWFVSGREGLSQLGHGGKNAQLLPRVGAQAPNFAAIDLNAGKIVHLSDYKGHPVWINFWGSWCAPCRAETPDIEAAYQQLAPKGVVMLAISLDETPQAAWNYAQLNHVTYTILSDPNRDGTGPTYPINNFPTHIFVDANGVIRAIVLAPMDAATAEQYGNEILHPLPVSKT